MGYQGFGQSDGADIAERYVLLLDPMLATGGSAIRAIEVLREHQVPEERITFISLVSSPEGIRAVHERSVCGISGLS